MIMADGRNSTFLWPSGQHLCTTKKTGNEREVSEEAFEDRHGHCLLFFKNLNARRRSEKGLCRFGLGDEEETSLRVVTARVP